MKICSTISPDITQIARARGFDVRTVRVPGHVVNEVRTTDGIYRVDLSYCQFILEHDLFNRETRQKALEGFRELAQDPRKAYKIEKLTDNPEAYFERDSDYENDVVERFEQYDPVEAEEFFPEKFKKFK